jgi:hypothetical protein
MIERLLGLELHLGVFLADLLVLDVISAALGLHVFVGRMVVELHVRLGVLLRPVRVGDQLLARLLEVVVVVLDLSGAESPLRRPVIDMFAVAPLVAAECDERRRLVLRDRLV